MEAPHLIVIGEVEVDLSARRVSGKQGEHKLTALEVGVLRYLADRSDTDVPRDELLARVWGSAPQTRSRAVDFVVSRLRQKLGEAGRERLLTSHGVGYRLVMGRAAQALPVSAGRAQIKVSQGRLDLDRRWFVPEGGEPVVLSQQEALVVERLASTTAFVPREGLERELWHRPTPHAFQAVVQRLKRKLGAALVVERGLGLRLERESTRTNLPPSPDVFFERAEGDLVMAALSSARGVVLRGTAGVGKSRLALEIGHRLLAAEPSLEVWWIGLSGALGVGSFLHETARVLGIELRPGAPADQLGRALASRPATLLVLDNLEQLVECAPYIDAWMAMAPRVRILATSRCALPMAATEVKLGPLPLATALALFSARALAFPWVQTDPHQVRQVVERLDGLPLAIELAAARVEQLDRLARDLEGRLDLLAQGTRRETSPHSTLRGALDWSWALLDGPQREVLVRLSLFRATIAAPLVQDPPLVQALCDHSLVQETASGFFLTDTVRLYARDRLAQRGDREALTLDWAEQVTARSLVASRALGSARAHSESLRWLRMLRDDLGALAACAPTPALRARAAIDLLALFSYDGPEWGRIELLRAVTAPGVNAYAEVRLGEALYHEGQHEEALQCAATALERAADHPKAMLSARRLIATIRRHTNRRTQALTELESGRRLARAHGMPEEESIFCSNLANLLSELGAFAEARLALHEAEQLARVAERIDLLQGALANRVHLLVLLEEWTEALDKATEAVSLAQWLDSPHRLAHALLLKARAVRGQGDLAQADLLLEQASALLREMGSLDVRILWERALLAIEGGDDASAAQWFDRALSSMPRDTDRLEVQANQAVGALAAGDARGAARLFLEIEARFFDFASPHAVPVFLGFCAVALAFDHQRDEALRCAARARASLTPLPSIGPFLELVEATLASDPARLAAVLAVTPRGNQDTALLLRIVREHSAVYIQGSS